MPLLYETPLKYPAQVRGLQKATKMNITLSNPEETVRYENKTVDLGTVVRVSSTLYAPINGYTSVYFKRHVIFHRLNAGEWETIADARSPFGPAPVGDNEVIVHYTINKTGVHTFVAQFPGDAEYAKSTSPEAKVGVGVAVARIPKEYLIAGGLGLAGLILVGLALRRRR